MIQENHMFISSAYIPGLQQSLNRLLVLPVMGRTVVSQCSPLKWPFPTKSVEKCMLSSLVLLVMCKTLVIWKKYFT